MRREPIGGSAPPSTPSKLGAWLVARRLLVDEALAQMLPPRAVLAAAVHDAMEDALLGSGKRMRPLLCLAVGEIYRVDDARILPPAAAVEMVHAASLVLDDLPCMDDAAVRRGRPASHVAHGEAAAILASFALLNRAFGILAGEGDAGGTSEKTRALIARRVAQAVGTDGLIGGQCADLALSRPGSIGRKDPGTIRADLDTMETIHSRKTGSLFVASAEIGAHLGGATADELESLRAYARNLGLAFQIIDDLIDATGDASAAGKPVRADAPRGSFVTLSGIDGARTLAAELTGAALAAIVPFGRRGDRLRALAHHLASRDR